MLYISCCWCLTSFTTQHVYSYVAYRRKMDKATDLTWEAFQGRTWKDGILSILNIYIYIYIYLYSLCRLQTKNTVWIHSIDIQCIYKLFYIYIVLSCLASLCVSTQLKNILVKLDHVFHGSGHSNVSNHLLVIPSNKLTMSGWENPHVQYPMSPVHF